MTSSQRIGRALNSSDLRSDETHEDVDVLAALAFSPTLGSLLHRLSTANDASAFTPAAEAVARQLYRALRKKRHRVDRSAATAVATQALKEWAIGICIQCNGTGRALLEYVPGADNREADCGECRGTGLFRVRWPELRTAVGGMDEDRDRWEARFTIARGLIDDAYRICRHSVTKQLVEL